MTDIGIIVLLIVLLGLVYYIPMPEPIAPFKNAITYILGALLLLLILNLVLTAFGVRLFPR